MNAVNSVIGSEQAQNPKVNRRAFLQVAGLGTAGLATGVLPSLHKAEADDRIRINPNKKTIDFREKEEKYEARLQKIITGATKAGVLKSQDDFVNEVSGGDQGVIREPDTKAYKQYVEALKTGARNSFNHVGDFSSFLSGIYKGKVAKIINSAQAEVLLSQKNYKQAETITGRINGGLNSGYDIAKLKTWAAKEIRSLQNQQVVQTD